MTVKITEDKVKELIKTINKGLGAGLGQPQPGEMCVMHAISLVMEGTEYSDRPTCVNEVIADFDIELNDQGWSSNKARAKGMLREAVAKLGSSNIDGYKWLRAVAIKAHNVLIPLLIKEELKRSNVKAKQYTYFSGHTEYQFLQELAEYFEKHTYVNSEKDEDFLQEATDIISDICCVDSDLADALFDLYADDPEGIVENFVYYYPSNRKDEALKILSNIAADVCVEFKTRGSKFLYLLDK